MTCTEIQDFLLDDPSRRAKFDAHLSACLHCAGFVRRQEQLDLELLAVFDKPRLPADFSRQVLAAVDRLPPFDAVHIASRKAQFESEFQGAMKRLSLERLFKRLLWPGIPALMALAWVLTQLASLSLSGVAESAGIASYLIPLFLWLSMAAVLGTGGLLLAVRLNQIDPLH